MSEPPVRLDYAKPSLGAFDVSGAFWIAAAVVWSIALFLCACGSMIFWEGGLGRRDGSVPVGIVVILLAIVLARYEWIAAKRGHGAFAIALTASFVAYVALIGLAIAVIKGLAETGVFEWQAPGMFVLLLAASTLVAITHFKRARPMCPA